VTLPVEETETNPEERAAAPANSPRSEYRRAERKVGTRGTESFSFPSPTAVCWNPQRAGCGGVLREEAEEAFGLWNSLLHATRVVLFELPIRLLDLWPAKIRSYVATLKYVLTLDEGYAIARAMRLASESPPWRHANSIERATTKASRVYVKEGHPSTTRRRELAKARANVENMRGELAVS